MCSCLKPEISRMSTKKENSQLSRAFSHHWLGCFLNIVHFHLFSRLFFLKFYLFLNKNGIYSRCTCFDIHVHSEIVTTVKLSNMSISHSYCVCIYKSVPVVFGFRFCFLVTAFTLSLSSGGCLFKYSPHVYRCLFRTDRKTCVSSANFILCTHTYANIFFHPVTCLFKFTCVFGIANTFSFVKANFFHGSYISVCECVCVIDPKAQTLGQVFTFCISSSYWNTL